MSAIPFVLSLDASPYYGPDIFPNRMFRRLHERQHSPLDLHTLGLMARWGAHAHQLVNRRHGDEFTTDARMGPSHFEVHLDVGLFEPNELVVKLINDNAIVVEGKHEEREDEHGSISRHFVRRFDVPKGYDVNAIASSLSSDKVLTVRVPKVSSEENNSERIVHIQQTGPSDFFLQRNGTESGGSSSSKQTDDKGT